MLATTAVTVRYDEVVAVDDVTLRVADGRVLALLGPSGCGKSTLLRAISGIEPMTSGQIAWDGVNLATIPIHRRGFGLMFQEGVLFPHRTVAGNIGYGLRSGGDDGSRIAELLDLVGLPGYESRRVTTLSGGEAQRVALARALAPRPRLLLLDEPLAALDRALHDQLLTDLKRVLTDTGTTAIFVTHDQDEAFAVADDLAIMRAGRIVQSGSPQQVWGHPADRETARFLGCTSVLDGEPQRLLDGASVTRTPVGTVPGTAHAVGLRPAALIVDDDGALRGEVAGVVPGAERQLVTVQLLDDADHAAPGDGAHPAAVRAVAPAGRALTVGGVVRLRFDPRHTALVDGDARN